MAFPFDIFGKGSIYPMPLKILKSWYFDNLERKYHSNTIKDIKNLVATAERSFSSLWMLKIYPEA